MVFLLKTKTSKKDVPIDRLPFMISEKTDCLGSRFFRIPTYYLLPLRISLHWPPAANTGRISCSQAASQPHHIHLTAIRHFIAPNSIRNFLSQFYNFYAFNNGLVRLQDAKCILIFECTKDKKRTPAAMENGIKCSLRFYKN